MWTVCLLWIGATAVAWPLPLEASRILQEPVPSDCRECDRVVARVVPLLPRRPAAVVVIDASRSSTGERRSLEHVDGFVVRGERTVYLRKESTIMQKALGGAGIWDYVLAIIVWHEMAHIDGANEREAQLREEELWKEFIVHQRVDAYRGLNYLRLLEKRRQSPLATRGTPAQRP